MDENQRFLGEFGKEKDYREEIYPNNRILDKITNSENKLSSNTNRLSINNKKFGELPEKNERLKDPLYSVFGYPSKLYYKNIEEFIEYFTKEGNIVLDPMAGSGSTGIAALSKNRKAVLNDGSGLSYFIIKNTLVPVNSASIQYLLREISKSVREEIRQLYETPCKRCGEVHEARNIFHSDVYECPSCSSEFPLYGNGTENKSEYKCPYCTHKIKTSVPKLKNNYRTKRRNPITVQLKCDEVFEEEVTSEIQEHWRESYKKVNEKNDIRLPEQNIITDRWYTRDDGWAGIPRDAIITDLFTDRNALALGLINNRIGQEQNQLMKEQLQLSFLASLIRSSNRMYTTSVVKSYYHVPSVGKVQNVWRVFERKVQDLIKANKELNHHYSFNTEDIDDYLRVHNNDARTLPLENNSIDYVFLDPPYGSQVGYYELNHFYSSWLQGYNEPLDEEVIIPMETDDKKEYANKWKVMMKPIIQEVQRVLAEDHYLTIVFHSRSSKIWNNLRELLFNELGFEYYGYVDADRGTTIHTNRLSNTNVKQGFLSIKNTGKEKNFENKLTINERRKIKDFIEDNFDEDNNLEEVYDEVVKYVHNNNINKVPPKEEIKNILK